MKIKDLKEFIKDLGDDFEFELVFSEEIPEETLKEMSYPYPFNHRSFDIKGISDIGYSDKVVKVDMEELSD